jgi:hypothetical protein
MMTSASQRIREQQLQFIRYVWELETSGTPRDGGERAIHRLLPGLRGDRSTDDNVPHGEVIL